MGREDGNLRVDLWYSIVCTKLYAFFLLSEEGFRLPSTTFEKEKYLLH